MKIGKISKTLCTLATVFAANFAQAEGLVDPSRAAYLEAFKGKSLAYLPLTMGADLTRAWGIALERQAKELGYSYTVRDPNWSADVGAQALTQLISEKPDILVVQSPGVQTYARLLKQAEAAGIYVIQANLKSSYISDGYVGVDYNGLGRKLAELVVEQCGKGSGKSGKVSIVQGALNSGVALYQIEGIMSVLSQYPEITIVSNQSNDWDASKGQAITQTVLQQHPDLCAAIGNWGGVDTGISAAVREAGKTDQVFVITSGEGAQNDCDNVKNGNFSAYISFDGASQGRDMNAMIATLLQMKPKPGSVKLINYSPLTVLTKETLKPGSCFSLPKG